MSTACGTWTADARVPGGGGSFPALALLDGLAGNLPEQVTSFVGRQSEVAELVDVVGLHRLVTLTGGVGWARPPPRAPDRGRTGRCLRGRGVAGGVGPDG